MDFWHFLAGGDCLERWYFKVRKVYSALQLMLVSGGNHCINILVQKGPHTSNWVMYHIGPHIELVHTPNRLKCKTKVTTCHIVKSSNGLQLTRGNTSFSHASDSPMLPIFPIHHNSTTHFKSITWRWVPLSVILTQPDIYFV